MITDLIYLQYGFEKEAIKAAMNAHNIYEDPNFNKILLKLEEYQKDSFLNI